MIWLQSTTEPSARGQTELLGSGCPWWDDAARQFEAILRLPGGWDSHGGDPPDPDIVAAARGLLRQLCAAVAVPRPHINPTPSGGVQFEWEQGGRYFELETIDETTAVWFYQDSALGIDDEGELGVADSLDAALDYIQRVAEGGGEPR